MIYNEETMKLEDKANEILTSLCQSPKAKTYQETYKVFSTSKKVAEKKEEFLEAKKAYDKIASYGTFAPDYRETYRRLRKVKREFDLLDEVGAFKAAQTAFQEELDEVAVSISRFISKDILVEYGNPFYHQGEKKHSCQGGGCQQHGS